jgi:hypothetical protein
MNNKIKKNRTLIKIKLEKLNSFMNKMNKVIKILILIQNEILYLINLMKYF